MDVGREKKNLLVKSRSAFPGISWGNVTLAAALRPWLGGMQGLGDKAENKPLRSEVKPGVCMREVWEGAVKCIPLVEAPY